MYQCVCKVALQILVRGAALAARRGGVREHRPEQLQAAAAPSLDELCSLVIWNCEVCLQVQVELRKAE